MFAVVRALSTYVEALWFLSQNSMEYKHSFIILGMSENRDIDDLNTLHNIQWGVWFLLMYQVIYVDFER